MNFSFSEVKTSMDKSGLYDKNLMVLYTENPHMLTKVNEDNEDEDYSIKKIYSY